MEEIPVHVGRFTECPVIRGDGERRVAVRGIDAAALRDRDDAKSPPRRDAASDSRGPCTVAAIAAFTAASPRARVYWM